MFFDIIKGKFGHELSDDLGMDSDGDMMMRVGDHMAMDLSTGEMHPVSGWDDDDNDRFGFRSAWDDDDNDRFDFHSSWDNDDNGSFGCSWDDDD